MIAIAKTISLGKNFDRECNEISVDNWYVDIGSWRANITCELNFHGSPWVISLYFFSHFLQDGDLNNSDLRGYLCDGVNGWMALFWVACARLSDCREVKGRSAWSGKLSHQVLRSLDVIRELKQGRFSATNVNRRWGLSFLSTLPNLYRYVSFIL